MTRVSRARRFLVSFLVMAGCSGCASSPVSPATAEPEVKISTPEQSPSSSDAPTATIVVTPRPHPIATCEEVLRGSYDPSDASYVYFSYEPDGREEQPGYHPASVSWVTAAGKPVWCHAIDWYVGSTVPKEQLDALRFEPHHAAWRKVVEGVVTTDGVVLVSAMDRFCAFALEGGAIRYERETEKAPLWTPFGGNSHIRVRDGEVLCGEGGWVALARCGERLVHFFEGRLLVLDARSLSTRAVVDFESSHRLAKSSGVHDYVEMEADGIRVEIHRWYDQI